MNKQELNEKLLDQMLAYASQQRMEEIAGECAQEERTDFTPRLEKRISHIINRQKRKYRMKNFNRTLLKAGMVTAVHILVITAAILHVGALAVRSLDIHSVIGNRCATIYVAESYGEKTVPELPGIYVPSYIPHGYAIEGVDKANKQYTISFAGPGGAMLTLKNLGINSTVEIMDAEELRQISVDDEPAQLAVKDGVLTLVFEYNEHAFMLTGQIREDEIEKVARSMEIKAL